MMGFLGITSIENKVPRYGNFNIFYFYFFLGGVSTPFLLLKNCHIHFTFFVTYKGRGGGVQLVTYMSVTRHFLVQWTLCNCCIKSVNARLSFQALFANIHADEWFQGKLQGILFAIVLVIGIEIVKSGRSLNLNIKSFLLFDVDRAIVWLSTNFSSRVYR